MKRLWRVTPLARQDFGRRTVWYALPGSAQTTLATFSAALADPVGLFVAEVETQYVVSVPGGRSLRSERALALADELIAEAVGHHWLSLWDGPYAGGTWETWVYLGDEPIEARAVPERSVLTVPAGWK